MRNVGWLVEFYGISTLEDYLISNPVDICIYQICMIYKQIG